MRGARRGEPTAYSFCPRLHSSSVMLPDRAQCLSSRHEGLFSSCWGSGTLNHWWPCPKQSDLAGRMSRMTFAPAGNGLIWDLDMLPMFYLSARVHTGHLKTSVGGLLLMYLASLSLVSGAAGESFVTRRCACQRSGAF